MNIRSALLWPLLARPMLDIWRESSELEDDPISDEDEEIDTVTIVPRHTPSAPPRNKTVPRSRSSAPRGKPEVITIDPEVIVLDDDDEIPSPSHGVHHWQALLTQKTRRQHLLRTGWTN